MPCSMKAVKANIYGKFQGVWHRAWTKEQAESLGLSGYVKNLTDGSVEALFCGNEEKVAEILKRCHDGPEHAVVDKIDTAAATPETEYSGFSID